MPELPEVDAIKLQLQKYLVGHRVQSVKITAPKVFEGAPKKIIGGRVKGVRRFGKVIAVDLDNGYSLMVHVKLTGQLIYRGPNLSLPPGLSKKVTDGLGGKYTHVVLGLDRGGKLFYNDVRRFGWIKVVETSNLEAENEFVKNLGPEPFRDLTLEKFFEMASKTTRAIKVLVMDQKKMAGGGNIYANDALFLARIDPKRPANSLSSKEARNLYESILEVLKRGMKYGGASELAFVRPDGTEGTYQNHALVYGKKGAPCPGKCGGTVVRTTLGGRGTFWCAACQK